MLDFSKFRKRLKQAEEATEEIAVAADKLENLIHQFSGIGVNGPVEFYSIPHLLRNTDNHREEWRAVRTLLLGDPIKPEPVLDKQLKLNLPPSESERILGSRFFQAQFVSSGNPVDLDQRAELSYGWGKSPPLQALLRTVASAARKFKPSEDGCIGAAILSRKNNPKIEYLRAFGYLLTHVHKFDLTKTMKQAMAVTAKVVINDPDVDVTYEDVQHSLSTMKIESVRTFQP